MNEKELQEYMKKMAENISVPDSLKPENIEKRLAETKQEKRSPFFRRRNLVAAAVLLLFLTAAGIAGRQFVQKQGTDSVTVADNTPSPDSLSYEEAYQSIHDYYETGEEKLVYGGEKYSEPNGIAYENESDDAMYENESTGDAPDNASVSKSKSAGGDFTETDVQVDGVMEGDIVKTDGSYLYSLHDKPTGCGITIYSVNGAKVKKVSNITTEQNNVNEMYLEKGRLILVSQLWSSGQPEPDSPQEKQTTQIEIYDVSDPASPEKLRTQTQSGEYITSRVSDGFLYTFSKYSVASNIDKDEPATYIPRINGTILPEEKVRCVDREPEKDYMVMTSLAVDGKSDYTDTVSTLGGANVYYVSNEAIYNTEYLVYSLGDVTKISKYLYKDGTFTFKTSCQVRGSIQNSYYLHEQNGNLCYVYNKTSLSSGMTNGLCILDPDLKLLGEISNLGNEEQIYASYFMGNTAYFVTYRETDPVFAVDLSDPKKPELRSELKLPGYSDYLHSFGDNRLIGIGIDEYGDFDECAKISIFSVSKKKKITQTAKIRLKDYEAATASADRHSVLIDEKWQLVGFPANNWDSDKPDYLLYSYDGKTKTFTRLLKKEKISARTRGLRIGDYFYLVDGETGVTCYKFPKSGRPGKLKKPLSFEKK